MSRCGRSGSTSHVLKPQGLLLNNSLVDSLARVLGLCCLKSFLWWGWGSVRGLQLTNGPQRARAGSPQGSPASILGVQPAPAFGLNHVERSMLRQKCEPQRRQAPAFPKHLRASPGWCCCCVSERGGCRPGGRVCGRKCERWTVRFQHLVGGKGEGPERRGEREGEGKEGGGKGWEEARAGGTGRKKRGRN